MSVQVFRPDVADLNVMIFGRPIHPELLVFHERTTIAQSGFHAQIALCDVGHLIQWQSREQTLCEIVASRELALPRQRRLFDRKLRGCRDESLHIPNGASYQLSFQVEHLSPDIFLQLHAEFLTDCHKATLGHVFATNNRLAPPAISYLQADLFPRSLLVHAFHTFPENCAVVKTQSLIELPAPAVS